MRKISRIALLGLAMAGAFTATAVKPAPFPASALKAAPQRVSPNAERAAGTPIFASLQFTYDQYPGYVTFGSENPMLSMHQFFDFRNGKFGSYAPDRIQSSGGLYNPEDGYYYMIRQRLGDTLWAPGYAFNYIPDCWMRFKADGTGEIEELYDMYNLYAMANNFTDYTYDMNGAHYQPTLDMFYDYRTKKFMGIRFQPNVPEGELVYTEMNEIDPATGIFSEDQKSGSYYYFMYAYMAMTCDLDGNLYALRADLDKEGNSKGTILVKLDRDDYYEETLVATIKHNGQSINPAYQACLEMDRTTNHFFVTMYGDDGYFRFFEIDDNGKQVNSEGRGLMNYITKGLYVPYVTADSRQAAGRVSDLAGAHDPEGQNAVTLTWTNPKKQWNNKKLTSLASVIICRDDLNNEIGSVEAPQPGEASTYVDNDATPGLHTYYVVPMRVANEHGVRDSIRVFAGHDVPDAPRNLKAVSPDAKKINLSWDAPEVGAQDGWIDAGSLSYNITRMPDKAVVATGLTATKFTDTNLGDVMAYYYIVEACNGDGTGLSATSNEAVAGKAVSAPYTFDFANNAIRGTFQPWNPTFGANTTEQYESNNFWQAWKYNPTSDNPSYLFSPAIKMTAGQQYAMDWSIDYGSFPVVNRTYEVTLGIAPAVNDVYTDMTTDDLKPLATYTYTDSDSNYIGNYEAIFTPETDGEYYAYFTIKITNRGDDSTIFMHRVIGMSVIDKYDKDMRVLGIRGVDRMPQKKATPVYVDIQNFGTKAAKDYKIMLLQNGEDVIGECTNVPELQPMEKARVTVLGATLNDPGNPLDVSALIEQPGDGNLDNNESDYTRYSVEVGVNAPFNVHPEGDVFNDDKTGDQQPKTMPFSLLRGQSLTQTIYPVERFNLNDCDATSHIARIAYIYNNVGNKNFTDSITVSYAFAPQGTGKFKKDMETFTNSDGVEVGKNATYGYCINAWPASNFKVCYVGNMRYIPGRNALILDLDEPFEYMPGYDLVLAFEHVGESSSTDFKDMWFDQYDTLQGVSEGWSTRMANGKWEDLDKSQGVFVVPEMPATYFAFNDGTPTGVKSIMSADGKRGSIDLFGDQLLFNGVDAISVTLYDMTGRAVSRANARGLQSIAMPRLHGLYVIVVTDATGARYVRKAAL